MSRLELEDAPDVAAGLKKIIAAGSWSHIRPGRLFCVRSRGSSARARARIWALPLIWQRALGIEPAYIIEVLAEKFNPLSAAEKHRTLIHELTHIPKNFSGSLLPHWRRLFRRQ